MTIDLLVMLQKGLCYLDSPNIPDTQPITWRPARGGRGEAGTNTHREVQSIELEGTLYCIDLICLTLLVLKNSILYAHGAIGQ